ncbi:hypothetical protein J1614_003572 [Plenodomus biglobosus]|nr:hypothetical protein J1614_003572 [Plenodomus biglobosus]
MFVLQIVLGSATRRLLLDHMNDQAPSPVVFYGDADAICGIKEAPSLEYTVAKHVTLYYVS